MPQEDDPPLKIISSSFFSSNFKFNFCSSCPNTKDIKNRVVNIAHIFIYIIYIRNKY